MELLNHVLGFVIGAGAALISYWLKTKKLRISALEKFITQLGSGSYEQGIIELEDAYEFAEGIAQASPEERREAAVNLIKQVLVSKGLTIPDYLINLAIEFIVAQVKARTRK